MSGLPEVPQIRFNPQASLSTLEFWWQAPLNNGGALIQNYTLLCSSISYSTVVGPSSFYAKVTPLINSQDYTFQLAAANTNGLGPYIAFTTAQPGIRPTGITNLAVSTLNATSANVVWAFNQATNESGNRYFLMSVIPSTQSAQVSSFKIGLYPNQRSALVSNLSTMNYTFLVQSINDANYSFPNASTIQYIGQIGFVVATGTPVSGTSPLYTSDTNGASWVAASNTYTGGGTFTVGSAVGFNGTQYIAGLGTNGRTISYSSDGKIWTASSVINSTVLSDIAWNGSTWAVTTNYPGQGNTVLTSNDGINWTVQTASTFNMDNSVNNIVWVGGGYNRWIMSGSGQGNPRMFTSPNGSTWTYSRNTGNNTTCMKWNGSMLLVGLSGAAGLQYSVSPYTTFTTVANTVFTTQCNGVAWNGSIWVAVGQGTNTIAHSPDGINWTGIGTSIFSSTGTRVTWNQAAFVASGTGTNTLAYSINGINWIGAGTGTFSVVNSVCGAYVWPV
jgi:hypothetical protein